MRLEFAPFGLFPFTIMQIWKSFPNMETSQGDFGHPNKTESSNTTVGIWVHNFCMNYKCVKKYIGFSYALLQGDASLYRVLAAKFWHVLGSGSPGSR